MNKKTIILTCFIIAKFLLQYLLINPAYDLHRDEYLHLDQGKHLAWGYISVPPLTSWISYIIKLLGNGVFWVKFFPAFFGALTIIVVWKIMEELKGNLFALVLGSLAILLSVILRINILYQPNSFDIFFWTLVYFTVIKYINSGNFKWLYASALAFGFGFLSKYNIAFLALGLLPAILLTEHRKIFLQKELYVSIGIVFIIISPNIIWQYKNNFPTVHQLQELSGTQLINVSRWGFIKEQFLFFIGSIFIVIASFISLLFYQPFKKYRLFFYGYFITILVYVFLKAKAYYAIGLYPVLIAFGSVYLEKITGEGRRKFLKPLMIVLVVALSTPFILIAFPYKSPEQIQKISNRYKSLGLLRWEDGKDHSMPQDFADMLGWSELAGKTDSVYGRLADKTHTLVLCYNYGQAGAINYYSKFKDINAVSFNADYINWIPLDREIKNLLLVEEAEDDDSTIARITPLFTSATLAGENNNPYSREVGTKIFLFEGAKTDINKLIKKKMNEYKSGQ